MKQISRKQNAWSRYLFIAAAVKTNFVDNGKYPNILDVFIGCTMRTCPAERKFSRRNNINNNNNNNEITGENKSCDLSNRTES